MAIQRVAVIFDDKARPETTGVYCLRALGRLVAVEHFCPDHLDRIPRQGFDLYLSIDDGFDYRLPDELRPRAWWVIDTHLNFDRDRVRAADYDIVFAAQRDGAEGLRRAGISSASWLPLACDPDIHAKHDVPKEHDVCFVGNVSPGPRADLLLMLQQLFPRTFVGRRYFEEMARTYSASRIVFNRSIRNDVNMRVFEALSCGSLLMTNDLGDNGQSELFRDGVHLAAYRDADEMVDKIRFYLAKEAIRERVASAGRAEAHAKHTYRHRMETLLSEAERRLVRANLPAPDGQPAAAATPVSAPAGESAEGTPLGPDRSYYECARPELLQRIPLAACRILDVGCGVGRLGEALKARQTAEVVGIELNPEAAEQARQRLDRVFYSDVEELTAGFAPGVFDAIVCGDVLEHLRDPETFLRRARTWLATDGLLIASIPNVRHHTVVRALLAGDWSYETAGLLDCTHLRFFTRATIHDLLAGCGYEVQTVDAVLGPGDAERVSQWSSGAVHVGRLHIEELTGEQAGEYFAYQYLVTARRSPTPTAAPGDRESQAAGAPMPAGVIWRRKVFQGGKLPATPAAVEAGLLPADAARILDLTGESNVLGGVGEVEGLCVGYPATEAFAPDPAGFDAILCGRLLERVQDPLELLGRARGWLRPGGRLLARTANVRRRDVISGLLEGVWEGGNGPGAGGRIRYYTRREIEKLFFRAGYTLEILQGLADYDRGRDAAAESEIQLGPLHIRGLAAAEAEEFFAADYLIRAASQPLSDYGLTSIVLQTHNQLAYTRLCLDSIRRFTDEPYEVIVVDNASTDGTPEYLQSLDGLVLIRNQTNRGFPAAANQGMRAAKGRQVLLLNNDTIVTTGWLRRMLDALQEDPRIGLVGPCSNMVSGEQQIPADYDDDLTGLDGFAWEWGKANDHRQEETERLVGFCLLIRREVIECIGHLDEQFGVGCFEDDDYCRRAIRAGFRAVIARDSFVHHCGGRTFVADGVDYEALLHRNRELYRNKWQGTSEQGGVPAVAVNASAARPSASGNPRILLLAHVDPLGTRMDKSHFRRYEALARRPGVALFGPGVPGYHAGMSVREAVEAACGGVWPDVIIHGTDHKESGIPLVTGLQDARVFTAIELLDSWTSPERQADFINRNRFGFGLIQEAGQHVEWYRARCPATEFLWTPNAVDTRVFFNRNLPNEFDVILYGELDSHVYPFRSRLARLLAKQSGLRFRHIPHPGYYPRNDEGVIAGAELSREINKAWIGIATRSIFNCLLMKYLEIAASHALVAGDMPDHARSLFGSDFLELRMEQSDADILTSLHSCLADKARLAAMTDAAHQRVVKDHSTDAFANRIFQFFQDQIAKRRENGRTSNGRAVAPDGPCTAIQTAREPSVCFGVRAARDGGLLLQKREVVLSLCMIVRDNARTIEACLASIRPWVDEMCVVDTGSVDETPRIAARLGARVFHFPWCDSFSAARNESLRHARGKWIFWMDSDDVISPESGRKLRALIEPDPGPSILGFVMQVHCPGAGDDGDQNVTVVDHVKLFRNLPHLRFDGRIHEQILPAIRRSGGETAWTDVFVVHAGYDHSPEGQERKKERDLKLLHLELEDRPEHPFTLFNLGMTYADFGEFEQAADYLSRSLRRSGEGESHLRKVYALLTYCHHQLGRPDRARETCERGLRLFPEDLELRFRRAILLHEVGRLEESAAAYVAILQDTGERYFTSMNRCIRGFGTRQNLAVVYADMADLARSEEQWRLTVQEAPRYRAGWRGLGDVLLRQGKRREADALAERMLAEESLRAEGLLLSGRIAAAAGELPEARRRIREAAAQDDADVLESCCQFLFESGEPSEAEEALKNLIRLKPGDAAAFHNLGTVFFRQGQAEDAATAYRRSLQLRPASVPTWLRLGDALQQAGHPLDAAEAWGQAARLDPGNPEAAEALGRAGQAAQTDRRVRGR